MARHKTGSTLKRTAVMLDQSQQDRIGEVLDEGRRVGALPMSCDSMSAFIRGAIDRELARVQAAIKRSSSK